MQKPESGTGIGGFMFSFGARDGPSIISGPIGFIARTGLIYGEKDRGDMFREAAG